MWHHSQFLHASILLQLAPIRAADATNNNVRAEQLQAAAKHAAAALANRDIPADAQPTDLNEGRRYVQEVAGVRVDQVEL